MRRTGPRVSMALLVCSIVMAGHAKPVGSQTTKDNHKPSAQSHKYVRPTDPSLYVGTEVCKTCHEDIYNHFATGPHFVTTIESKLDAQKGPEWHGCESCHGPGKEHVARRNQRPLPGLPPEQSRTEQLWPFRPFPEWRGMHRLSFATSRSKRHAVFTAGIVAETLLHLPLGCPGTVRASVSPSCK
jgi:hypothetical protein